MKQPDFTPGQAEEAKKRKARALTLQQERAEQAEKRRNTCSFTAVRLCAGQKCYFQPGISDNLGREAVNMKRVRLTRRWIEADWFVLERIGDMATQNLAWAACLLGGFLVDATYMQDAVAGNPSGEPRGVCVAFKAALGTKRRVWCSARFQQLDVYQTMAACVGQAGSQWKFVDLEDFCRERGKRNASLKAIAFVTDDEQDCVWQTTRTHTHTQRHRQTQTDTDTDTDRNTDTDRDTDRDEDGDGDRDRDRDTHTHRHRYTHTH